MSLNGQYLLCLFGFFERKGGMADGIRMIRKISKKRTGIQIRKLMNERGVTVMQVQDYLDIDSPQAIYKWLQGVNLPSVIHLYGLSQILDAKIEEILAEEEEDDEWEGKTV